MKCPSVAAAKDKVITRPPATPGQGGSGPVAEGNRLYLRAVRLSDVNERYLRWMNDLEVTRYLESGVQSCTLEDLRAYVAARQSDPASVFLAIVLKAGDRHIGNVKVGPIDDVSHVADVGILVGEKDCWGQGYATEAIRLVADYAFQHLGLHKLTAGVYGANHASIRAFEQAGFLIEGVRKEQFLCRGEYVDETLLGRVRPNTGVAHA